MNPKQKVQEETTRMLAALRDSLSARDLSQVEVQKRLGWGRSSICDILAGRNALRLESLLLILEAIEVSPGEFFAELYAWPPLEASDSELPQLDATDEVDRVLGGLAQKIRSRGATRTSIERRLGRGRDYIKRLMTKETRLRVDQVLSILAALEIEPGKFLWELYRPAQAEKARQRCKAGPGLEMRIEALKGAMVELSWTLVRKGLVGAYELPGLFRGGGMEEHPRSNEPLPRWLATSGDEK